MHARPAIPFLVAASALLTGLGCAQEPTGPSRQFAIPANPKLIAEATAWDGAMHVDCWIDFSVHLEPRGDHWFGTWGGEAHRKAVDATGAGVAYFADAFSQVRVDVSPTGAVTLATYRDDALLSPSGDSRFWDGILEFRGRMVPVEHPIIAEGEWSCRPMDTHDDSIGTVTGIWQLVREYAPPG
ncbi:MAG: hypothetical protein KF689_12710 [Gemmatimonadaceae bacterium]|nr:hypothetical protein [Gemmatimonadaceae bacterium]MCW5827156.1 hypothetical protein [Gemmatimonadaceae bacterium]